MRMRWVIGLVLVVALFVGALGLIKSGLYAWTLFAILPMIVGAVVVWVWKPNSQLIAAGRGALAAGLATLSFFAFGREGLFCILLSLPVALPFGALGGWLTYRLCMSKR